MATPTNPAGNTDLLKAINTLTKAIDGISKSMSSSSSSTNRAHRTQPGAKPGAPGAEKIDRRAKKEADQQYERNKRLARNAERHFGDLAAGLVGYTKSLNRLSQISSKNQANFKAQLKAQGDYTKSLLNNGKISKKYQDRFVANMEAVLKSSKAMGQIKLKSTSTSGRAKELLSIQDSMHDVLTHVSSVRSKTGAKSVAGMQEGDIKNIMKTLSSKGLSADGMGFEQFQKELSGHDKKIADKKRKIAKSGSNSLRREALEAELGILQSNKDNFLKTTGGKIDKAVGGVENFNRALTKNTISSLGLSIAADKTESIISKLGGSGISLASGFTMVTVALQKYYAYMKTLASNQMGGMHFNLAKDALKMGTSVEATMKYFQKFGMQVSQVGFDGMTNVFAASKTTLSKMGLYGDEALNAFSEMADDTIKMGVHPKDQKKFQESIKAYGAEVNELSKLTGATASQILAFNREIINNNESMEMMMRLGKEERKVKMDSIVAERGRLSLLLGSNEAAQKFIQTLQKLNSEGPEKRIENSMKIQQMMQMTGMGADAGKMSQILMKREDQLTGEEREFKANALLELGKRSKELQGGDMATELVMGKLLDSQPEAIKAAIQGGAEANLAKDQNGSVDRNGAVAKDVSDKKQIGQTTSNFMELTNWLGNAASNPILATLLGILAGVGVMSAATIFKGKGSAILAKGTDAVGSLLSKIGTKGGGTAAAAAEAAIAGGSSAAKDVGKTVAADATKTVAGDVSKTVATDVGKTVAKDGAKGVGKSILKKIPGIGLLAGLGFAASRAMDGDWLGAGGELASGAASTVPGIGTAASVAIDAAMLARDVSKSVDEAPNAASPAPNSNSTINPTAVSPNAVANVANPQQINTSTVVNDTNSSSNSKKATIEDLVNTLNSGTQVEQSKMDEMIKLLKNLIDAVNPQNNGLADAIRTGKGTGISFNDLQDKRTLFATK